MLGLMSSIRNLRNMGTMALRRLTNKRASSLAAVAGILVLGSVCAKDPVEKDAKSNGKGPAVRTANHEPVVIPECLEKLKLSTQQQEQIKGIIESYDQSLGAAKTQFGERYIQAIDLEAQLLSAIEDNLTEPQRQKISSHRLKTAKDEKAVEATNTKPTSTTAKLANEVDEELADVGVTLNAEQEAAAQKVEETYRSQFRSMNREIEGLHARLLSLTTSKMMEIEKVLTKEQLTELRSNRKNAPEAKLAVNKN